MRARLPAILAILFACGVLVPAALRGFTGSRASTVPSPLDSYTATTEDQARAFAERLVVDLNLRRPHSFDQALDLATVLVAVTCDTPMTSKQRAALLAGAQRSLGENRALSAGSQLVQSLGEDGRVSLVHVRVADGRQRIMLRVLGGDGSVNYDDLLLANDPSGTTRIIDFFSFASGEDLQTGMRNAVLPALASASKSSLSRLLGGGVSDNVGEQCLAIRRQLLAGQHAEAMAGYRRLPESMRNGKPGLLLRRECAAGLDAAEQTAALEALDAAFPGDPKLALARIDLHFMRKEWDEAQACVDQLRTAIGADRYLDCLSGNIHLESGQLPPALAAFRVAIEHEPDLVQAWWGVVTAALRMRDHPLTAATLVDMEQRFGFSYTLEGVDEYQHFVASPEYRAFLARAPATEPATAEPGQAPAAEPAP